MTRERFLYLLKEKLDPRIWYLNTKNGIKNWYYFSTAIWSWRWYDHAYTENILCVMLKRMADNLEKHGHEIDESRLQKVAQIRRAVWCLENYENGFPEQEELYSLIQESLDAGGENLFMGELSKEKEARRLELSHDSVKWEVATFKEAFDIMGQDMLGWWD